MAKSKTDKTDDQDLLDDGLGDAGIDELARMRELLEAAERRAEEAEERALEAERKSERGLDVRTGTKAFAGPDGGYKFRVGPKDKDKYPGLATVEFNAVDSTEAIRWYCESFAWPVSSRKQVDPIKIMLQVDCLESERLKKVVIHKQRCAGIRARLESGAALTEAETKFLEENEAEILQLGI